MNTLLPSFDHIEAGFLSCPYHKKAGYRDWPHGARSPKLGVIAEADVPSAHRSQHTINSKPPGGLDKSDTLKQGVYKLVYIIV